MAASRTDLSEVSVDDLLAEVQRRLDCQLKPEKRLILIGDVPPAAPPPVLAPVQDAAWCCCGIDSQCCTRVQGHRAAARGHSRRF